MRKENKVVKGCFGSKADTLSLYVRLAPVVRSPRRGAIWMFAHGLADMPSGSLNVRDQGE